MHISMHGNDEETLEAKCTIQAGRLYQEEGKCYVMMGSRAKLAEDRGVKVQVVESQRKEEHMV